jgi:hypothetical protein
VTRWTLLLVATVPLWTGNAEAKKRAPAATAQKKKEQPPPSPGDKRTNEGAQGRTNATEDASRSVESPLNERRP